MFIELTNSDADHPVTVNVAQIVNLQPVIGTSTTAIDLVATAGNLHAKQLVVVESYETVKSMIQRAAMPFL
ncbi:hypothetical protein PANO111632_17285 [Paracoccus nototheniae]|uniref:Uncharacterized protein n=1 Tax=Paracoccus nototheniae TaxID=2489002 RepID=A0ABW4DUS4_9RHOB|nr:hypothetical protein [Paracoccus nototheniae]